MYLRPSRYARRTSFMASQQQNSATTSDSTALLEEVSWWVGTRLNHVPGSSDPIDGAVDALLTDPGARRDFARLTSIG